MLKVIIAGGRDFKDYHLLHEKCKKILFTNYSPSDLVILSGKEPRGADALGERFAKQYGIKILEFPPDWNKYGKAAGPIRNRQMAENANALIAFDTSGRGTKNMIETANELGLKVRVINCKGE